MGGYDCSLGEPGAPVLPILGLLVSFIIFCFGIDKLANNKDKKFEYFFGGLGGMFGSIILFIMADMTYKNWKRVCGSKSRINYR
jgi:amino acid permease